MMSGKAVSRAIRGHFLVESALTSKLILNLVVDDDDERDDGNQSFIDHVDAEQEESDINMDVPRYEKLDVRKLKELDESLQHQQSGFDIKLEDSLELKLLNENLSKVKEDISDRSRITRYWIQYLHYVNVLKLYIRAERASNWELHLESIGRMIYIFAASGHINYAKCARLHLQEMMQLQFKHPWVYDMFQQGYHTVRPTNRFWAGLSSGLLIEQCLMRAFKYQVRITHGRSVTGSVRTVWISSIHRLASVRNAMSNLTGQHHGTNEQPIDLTNSRVLRDNKDLISLIDWFNLHDPFDLQVTTLRSISTGLTATEDDKINCDNIEDISRSIQLKLDNVCVESATIKNSDQVKTLDDLRPGINIDNKTVHIDPLILFARLTALLQREDDITDKFNFELTAEPTSLFKDGMMRKPNKVLLRNMLLDKVDPVSNIEASACVIDGGALLHKVKWEAKGTFKDVANKYINFLRRRYGCYDTISVVFDGYKDKTSIKTQEHVRRSKTMSASITIKEHMNVTCESQNFLRNTSNKEQLIRLLSTFLRTDGFDVVQCKGNADTSIAEKSIEYASEGKKVVVAADDTDVLVLLMHHWHGGLEDIFFTTEKKEWRIVLQKYWNVMKLVESCEYPEYILFAHAWCGCDTTSATFNQGKTNIIQLLKSEIVRNIANIFYDTAANFGGNENDTLTSLRYTKFMQNVTSKLSLGPASLPPFERAGHYHPLRVHLQVAQWKSLNLNCLPPDQWGWHHNKDGLSPVKTDLEPAELLNYIGCKCKMTSRNTCGSRSCSCRRNGLRCVAACGNCGGKGCENPSTDLTDEVDDYDDDLDRKIFDMFD